MKKLIISILVMVTMWLGLQPLAQAQESSGQTQEPAMQTQEPAMQTQEPAMQTQEPAMQMQETAGLEVSAAAICKDVVDREPVDAGSSFPAAVGKLYCFTRIIGAESPTQITHVWYFDDTERARVELAVNGITWRTYSSKIIQPHELGAWRVEVLDSEGKLLKALQFEITP